MKSTGKDYFAQLRTDYISPKKKHYNKDRRPFNPGNPNEFEYKPAAMRRPATDEENAVAANIDDNGVAFSDAIGNAAHRQDHLPANTHIF
jgi:hypothetical protein